ncbi:Transcription factor mtb1 [Datura stramonium]|nr:Transcription factor mtb1 [Datura stramonium]
MEYERERLVSTSRDALASESSNLETQNRVADIKIEAPSDEVVVTVRCPLETHPVSKVIEAFKEAQVNVVESKLAAGNDTVYHTFVVKSSGPEQLTKDKLMAAFSGESNSLQPFSSVG